MRNISYRIQSCHTTQITWTVVIRSPRTVIRTYCGSAQGRVRSAITLTTAQFSAVWTIIRMAVHHRKTCIFTVTLYSARLYCIQMIGLTEVMPLVWRINILWLLINIHVSGYGTSDPISGDKYTQMIIETINFMERQQSVLASFF